MISPDLIRQLADPAAPYTVAEILPGLFRIPVPLPRNPLRELNAYLIRGGPGERSLLIDTGFRTPECRQALWEGLAQAGAAEDPFDVLLTHIHTDHTGLSAEVAGEEGTIYIGEGDAPFTAQAWEDAYWRIIDQRFLQEGFPQEELTATTGTNPARTLGPPPGRRGQAYRGRLYLAGGEHPRPYAGANLPVAGAGGPPLHRRPCPL